MANTLLASRILAAVCWILSKGNINVAFKIWKARYKESVHGKVKAVRALITAWGPRFLQTGSLANKPKAKVERKIPDEVARECAQKLKEGYETKRKLPGSSGRTVKVRLHWTSIKKACSECPELKAAIKKYRTTPSALLRRMKEVDPRLKWRRLDYKNWLDTPQRVARQGCAMLLDAWVKAFGTGWLNSVFWIDECSIWLCAKNVKVHVWADAHDQHVAEVMHIDGLQPGAKIKVRFLVAVNALLGPFFIDFTTGTTNLKRRRLYKSGKFLVSGGGPSMPCRKLLFLWAWGLGFN
jgi:hypothetical protein